MTAITKYGIVALFDSKVNEAAEKLSVQHQQYSQYPTWKLYEIDHDTHETKHIPHCSFLHLFLDEPGLEECKKRLDRITKRLYLQGALSSVSLFPGGWLFWLLPRTPELDALHEDILRECAPLRLGNVSFISKKMDEVTKMMVSAYGFTNTGVKWNPHITIGCKIRQEVKLPSTLHIIPFTIWRMAICEMGPNGEVTKIIKEFPFNHYT